MAESSENILQAHFRIYNSLIFMISCYDIDYAYTYLNNLNNKTFKNYFKVIKTNDPEVINEVYDKTDNKIIIFVTKLPTPDVYIFNFINEVYHIHIALPNSYAKDLKDFELYKSEIQKIPIRKFINVKDKRKIYDNNIEDKLYDIMIELIDNKLNDKQQKFKRMPQTGGKLILYGERSIN
jgi:hypothetical protein